MSVLGSWVDPPLARGGLPPEADPIEGRHPPAGMPPSGGKPPCEQTDVSENITFPYGR